MTHSRKRKEVKICTTCGETNYDCLKKSKQSWDGVRSICYTCDARRQRIKKNGYDTPEHNRKEDVCRHCNTSENLLLKNGKRIRLCKLCAATQQKIRRDKNAEKYRESRNRSYKTRKLKIFQAYGGKCAVCGESRYEYLSIDHIHNNGAEHRRQIGEGEMVYLHIVKNNYPEGYQILCHNCHGAKSWHTSNPYIVERETREQIEGLHGEGI